MNWYLIRVRNNAGSMVVRRLQQSGVEAFQLTRFQPHGNGVRLFSPKPTKSYVFARLPNARRAGHTPGVSEVCQPISDGEIEQLRRAEGQQAVKAFAKALGVR